MWDFIDGLLSFLIVIFLVASAFAAAEFFATTVFTWIFF